MARYTDSVCTLCRREKEKLFLKGAKCYTEKCPVEKRNYPPGQHGNARRMKVSQYGIQLREKQKVKRTYGLLETQFHNTFVKASRMKGVTGENLVALLERRLDNLVYRLGFAPSRKSARQLVLHAHVLVNGKTVNIPSFVASAGDVIAIREKSKNLAIVHESLKRQRETGMPGWLSLDKAKLTGSLMTIPQRADVPLVANEQLIVELYSK